MTIKSDPKNMKAGDLIEFLSDRQTDKGPSSGVCVRNNGSTLTLSHSDIDDDIWSVDKLRVERVGWTRDGRRYWALV